MNYWIIENGITTGPLNIRQLAQRHISEQTPVWRSGLADWTFAGQLPEWPEIVAAAGSETCPEPAGEEPVEASRTEVLRELCADNAPVRHTVATASPAAAPAGEDCTPAPTYLGWSILATLLCCTVIGIVALVYALRVRDENRRGFYAAARHDSSIVELWLIAAITLGIVALPFNVIMAML